MTHKTAHVHLSSSGLCLEANSCKSLKRRRGYQARLVGQGIDRVCQFAAVFIKGELYFAEVVTGSIFDAEGRHHTDTHLHVEGLPHLTSKAIQEAHMVREPRV